jgi:hypothetical protein
MSILALLLPLLPGLLDSITKIYQAAAGAPETPAALKAHYAQLAADLEAVNLLVQSAPEPPEGSGA